MSVEIGSAVGYIDLDISGFRKGLQQAQAEGNNFSSGFSKSMESIGKDLTKTGKTMTASITAPLVGVGTAAVKTAMSFEKSMSQVQATMGVAKDGMYELNGEMVTGEQVMSALSEEAQYLGATTEWSAKDAADALNYLALAGYDTEKQIAALPSVLTVASAGNMDLAYASDLVTDSMSVLGLKTDDLNMFIDQMAKTASRSNTNVAQLGEAILVAGGQASICGLSTAELNTALGVLADNGMKGSKGGTMLRNALKNLYTPTKDSAEALEALGIKTRDDNGELLKLQDVLVQLGSRLDGMASGERVSAMADIFDTRTIGAANALLKSVGYSLDDVAESMAEATLSSDKYKFSQDQISEIIGGVTYSLERQADAEELATYLMDEYDMAAEDAAEVVDILSSSLEENGSRFDELQNEIEDSGGAAKKMADTQLDNLQGSITILKSAVEGLGITMGNRMTPKIQEAAKWLTELTTKFNNLPASTQENIIKFGALAVAIGPVLLVIGSLIKALGSIASAATTVYAALGPVGLAIAAVGATAAICTVNYNEWITSHEELRKKAQSLTESEQELADEIDRLSESYTAAKTAQDEANSSIEYQTQRENDLWSALQSVVDENGKVIEGHEREAEFITTKLSEALGIEIDLVDGQIQKYEELKGSIDDVIVKKQAEAMLSANEQQYIQNQQDMVEALRAKNEALASVDYQQQLIYATEERAERLQNAYNQAMQESVGYGLDMSDTAIQYGNALDDVNLALEDHNIHLDTLKGKAEEASAAYEGFSTDVSNYEALLASSVTGSTEEIQTALDSYKNHILDVETASGESLRKQAEDYRNRYNEMKQAADSGSSNITEKQLTEAKRMRDETYKIYQEWVNKSNQQYAENLTNVEKTSDDVANEGTNMVADMSTNFGTEMDGNFIPYSNEEMIKMKEQGVMPTVNEFPGIGEQLIEGLREGWNSKSDLLLADMRHTLEEARKLAEKINEVQSPSKVYARIGGFMAEGLAVGWSEEFENVKDVMASDMRSINNIMSADAIQAKTAQETVKSYGKVIAGGNTYNFYSPKAINEIEAARQLKITERQLAEGFI